MSKIKTKSEVQSKRLWSTQCTYPFKTDAEQKCGKSLRKPTQRMIKYLHLEENMRICTICRQHAQGKVLQVENSSGSLGKFFYTIY